MSERASLSPYHRDLMLSLAYLGGLTYALIPQLLPGYSTRTLQRDLTDLRKLGDVEKHALYKSGPKGRPIKVCDVWTLTDKGHEYIAAKANDQYPLKPARFRHKRVQAHDLLAAKATVGLIVRARTSDLSGVFVQLETRLNPDERRPIPDAVVIIQVRGGFGRTDIVPWTKDPAIEDEHRWRFAIEADNGTETLSVIAGKARAYGAAYANPEWRDWWAARFGPLPLLVWVVGNKEGSSKQATDRLLAIHNACEPVWPEGAWIGTTDQYVEKNIWLCYSQRAKKWGNIASFERPTSAQSTRLIDKPTSDGSSNATGSLDIASKLEQAHSSSQEPPLDTPDAVTQRMIATAASHAAGSVADTTPSSAGGRSLYEHRHAYPTSSTTVAAYRAGEDIQSAASNYYAYPGSPPPTRVYPTPVPVKRDFMEWWGIRWAVMLPAIGVYVFRVCTAPIRIVWRLLVLLNRIATWLMFDARYSWVVAEARDFIVVGILFFATCGGLALMAYQVRAEFLRTPTMSTTALPPLQPAPIVPVPAAQPTPVVPVPAAQPAVCGTARVRSDGLNLRARPGGAVLTVLNRDQAVVLLCDAQQLGASRWVRVRANRRAGWVNARYLHPVGPGG